MWVFLYTFRFGFLASIILTTCFLFVHAVYAQQFVPLADVTGSKLANLYADTNGDLSIFIGRLFGFALSIGAILAILRIAWGGYLYMTTDLWSTKERAREVLRETILGLLLLLAVWVILSQINPDILKLQLNIAPVPTPATTPTSGTQSSAPTSFTPAEGSSCTTSDGLPGIIYQGQCYLSSNPGPSTTQPTEGSGCITVDGIPGQIYNGQCVFFPG